MDKKVLKSKQLFRQSLDSFSTRRYRRYIPCLSLRDQVFSMGMTQNMGAPFWKFLQGKLRGFQPQADYPDMGSVFVSSQGAHLFEPQPVPEWSGRQNASNLLFAPQNDLPKKHQATRNSGVSFSFPCSQVLSPNVIWFQPGQLLKDICRKGGKSNMQNIQFLVRICLRESP